MQNSNDNTNAPNCSEMTYKLLK